jgi:hypothetical protein
LNKQLAIRRTAAKTASCRRNVASPPADHGGTSTRLRLSQVRWTRLENIRDTFNQAARAGLFETPCVASACAVTRRSWMAPRRAARRSPGSPDWLTHVTEMFYAPASRTPEGCGRRHRFSSGSFLTNLVTTCPPGRTDANPSQWAQA